MEGKVRSTIKAMRCAVQLETEGNAAQCEGPLIGKAGVRCSILDLLDVMD